MTRFIPRGQSRVQGEHDRAFDRPWYDYLRNLGVDLDSLQSDVATNTAHTSSAYGHGWTALTDQAIATGSNSIAHGLSTTPTEVMMVKDLAPASFVDATHNRVGGTQSLTTSTAIIEIDTEYSDWLGDFDTSTYLFTAPHTGVYFVETALTATTVASGRAIVANVTGSSIGTRWFTGIPSSFSTNVLGSAQLMLGLTAGETLGMYGYVTASTEVVASGSDETRFVVRSDDSWTMGTHDATNITIHSARARTMFFLGEVTRWVGETSKTLCKTL